MARLGCGLVKRMVLAVAAVAIAAPLAGADTATNPLEKLEAIESQVREDRQKVEGLHRSASQLVREQGLLRQRLIQAAAVAQAQERELNSVEQRLAMLETRETTALRALEGQRSKLANLLAVLQRIGREPPPALVVRPHDATAAARSAMLLAMVVPAVQTEAKRLGKNLSVLRDLRHQTTEERLKVAAVSSALEKDRNALTQMMAQRRTLAEQTIQNLQSTKARIQGLATEATDLRALIASLNEDASRPEIRGSGAIVTNQIASAGAARIAPLDGFKGRLKLPANGQLAANFGSADGSGGRLPGIYLDTLPGSGVNSPCDGKIMFAGPFRGYGQMLIIAANGGYHVLLAGLTRIDGVQGQVVLAGEPLGRMGPGRAQGQVPAQQGDGRDIARGKRLYIEFRHNGVPVDPVPWFAALRERVSG